MGLNLGRATEVEVVEEGSDEEEEGPNSARCVSLREDVNM